MPKRPILIHTVDKKIQKEIREAFTKKMMSVNEIAKRLELRLGWPSATAKYRVKRLLEDMGIELFKYPQHQS